MRRLALTFLMMLITTATAGAETIDGVKYIDQSGVEQTANGVMVLTGSADLMTLGTDGTVTWYVVKNSNTDASVNGGVDAVFSSGIELVGDVHLILADGAEMTVANNSSDAIGGSGNLTIYGQGGETEGALTATCKGNCICIVGNITINGGIVTTAEGSYGIYPKNGSMTINGGTVTAIGGSGGIFTARGTETGSGALTINGGTVMARGSYAFNIQGDLTINDGKVKAVCNTGYYGIRVASEGNMIISGGQISVKDRNGDASGIQVDHGNITLGLSRLTDYIAASRYEAPEGTVTVAAGQTLLNVDDYGNCAVSDINDFNSGTLYMANFCGKDDPSTPDVDEGQGMAWYLVDGEDGAKTLFIDVVDTNPNTIMNDYSDEARAPWIKAEGGLNYGITSAVICSGVTHIGNNAFKGCDGLTTVTMKRYDYNYAPTITTLGTDVFTGCTALTAIIVPEKGGKGEPAYKSAASWSDVKGKVFADQLTLFGTGTKNQWMTLCDGAARTLPTNCTAYVLGGVSGGVVTLNELGSQTVPAYVPVFIKRNSTGGVIKASFAGAGTFDAADGWDKAATSYLNRDYCGYNSVYYTTNNTSNGLVRGTIQDSDRIIDDLYGNSGTTGAAIMGVINGGSDDYTYFSLYNDQLIRLEGDPGTQLHRCVLNVANAHLASDGQLVSQLSIAIGGGEATGSETVGHISYTREVDDHGSLTFFSSLGNAAPSLSEGVDLSVGTEPTATSLLESEAVHKDPDDATSDVIGYRVYVRGDPDFGYTVKDMTVQAEVVSTGAMQARRRASGDPVTFEAGQFIDVKKESDGCYSFVMPKDPLLSVSVTASFPEKDHLTQVPYIDEQGKTATTPAASGNDPATKVYILDGTETSFGQEGETSWYIVQDEVNYTSSAPFPFYGDVHLILADGAAMNIETNDGGVIYLTGSSIDYAGIGLTIYGQSTGDNMGSLSAVSKGNSPAILVINSYGSASMTINGGKVAAQTLQEGVSDAIYACSTGHDVGHDAIVTINGGQVIATGGSNSGHGIQTSCDYNATVTINGGQVTATGGGYGIYASGSENVNINLGWTDPDNDFITASSYKVSGGGQSCAVKTADGKRFVAYNDAEGPAASAILGSLTSATVIGDLKTIDGKYLRPLDGYVVKCKKRLTFSGKTDTDGKPKPDFTITSVSSAFATSYYIFKKDATVTVVATGHDDDYAEIDAIDIDETRPFYLNETAAKSHAFTMPGQDIKISSVRYYNLGVEYMNWDSGEPVVAKTDANTKVYVLDGTDGDLYAGWHVVKEDICYSDGLQLFGDVHIILADGATMTIGTEENPLYDLGMVAAGSYCPISIYGQSKGTGTLSISVSANETAIFSSDPINLYSCELIIPSCKDGISGHKIGIYGCDVTMTNVTKDGIYIGYGYDLILRASSLRIHSVGNGIGCVNNGKVFYYGGQVDITAGASGNGISGDVTLCSWTSASDYFKASSYVGTVTIGTGYYFTYEGHTGEPLTGTVSDLATIAGQKLIPAQKKVIDGETYIAYSSGNGNWVLNDPNVQVYVITGYNLKTGVVYLMPVASNEIPDGVPVIFGNKTDGSPLIDDFFLVGELTVSAGAEADYKKAIANFVAGDGQTTLQGFIDGITGSTGTPVSDYVAFILDDDKFKPIIMNASSTPSNGACLLILPKVALLTQAVVGSTSAARMLTIDLGGNATGIRPTPGPSLYGGEWYDLQGRRLSGRPTAKGIYIHNGRTFVVQ